MSITRDRSHHTSTVRRAAGARVAIVVVGKVLRTRIIEEGVVHLEEEVRVEEHVLQHRMTATALVRHSVRFDHAQPFVVVGIEFLQLDLLGKVRFALLFVCPDNNNNKTKKPKLATKTQTWGNSTPFER